MRRRINPAAQRLRKQEIEEYINNKVMPAPVVTNFRPMLQWYIRYLDSKGIEALVKHLGCGVYKITVKTKEDK